MSEKAHSFSKCQANTWSKRLKTADTHHFSENTLGQTEAKIGSATLTHMVIRRLKHARMRTRRHALVCRDAIECTEVCHLDGDKAVIPKNATKKACSTE
eukprot:1140758-Pelagomonas_calceolata.AAC.8